MKHLFKMMSLIAAVIFGAMVMYSCTIEDEDNEIGGDDGGDTPSQIQGPKWVLVDVWAPDITEEDVYLQNKNSDSVYKRDSVKVVATKTSFSGYYGESVDERGGAWAGGYYLFCFEITKIPQELEGGGKITLYSKATLPKHYGAKYDDNSYIQWHYYHCECYVDCRIDGNLIRIPEEVAWDKYGGYNVPLVQMNNNAPDIYENEATIIGDVPKGSYPGQKIELVCGVPYVWVLDKYIEATYTYEWRE